MACHRRCTFASAFIFSLLMVALMLVELLTPFMWFSETTPTATGLLATCETTLKDYTTNIQACLKTIKFEANKEVILSIVVLALALVWFIGSFIILIKLCRSSSEWPKFFKRWVIFGIILNLINAALVGVTCYLLQTKEGINFTGQDKLSISFYAIVVVGVLHLVTFIMLICILCCKSKDDDDDGDGNDWKEDYPWENYPQTRELNGDVKVNRQPELLPEYSDQANIGWKPTFPSNIQFADVKLGGKTPLYRDFLHFTKSTVYGSE